jgi:hypothetical protein
MKRNLFFIIILLTAAAIHSQGFTSQMGIATQEMEDEGLVGGHSSFVVGSKARVSNPDNGKEIEITIIRRLSPSPSRIIDLSPAAAQALGLGSGGRVVINTIRQVQPPQNNDTPAPIPPSQQEKPSINIVNYTGSDINIVIFRYAESANSTISSITGIGTVKNGATIAVHLPEPLSKVNRYDIEVSDANGKKYERKNITVSANARFEFGSSPPSSQRENPSFTVENKTGESINAFYVRYAGSDWIKYTFTGNKSIDNRDSFTFQLPNPLNAVNRYDIRLERPNSLGIYTKNTVTVSSGGRVEFASSDKDASASAVVANTPQNTPNTQQYDPESDFRVARRSDDKSVKITGYAGTKQTVRIPPMIQGLPVTEIGKEAFMDKNITSVTIPTGVTTIGVRAFLGCSSLANVTMPNTLEIIDFAAFVNCTSLASVTIPASVEIIDRLAFANCVSLANVTIPNGVIAIGEKAFRNSLSSVTFQGSIDRGGFGFTFVDDIDIPLIGDSPFDGDLKEKYLAGGVGTYTRARGSNTWTKR